MTQVALDEVMLREPRLLVPGMQPLGPVKLDATAATFIGGLKQANCFSSGFNQLKGVQLTNVSGAFDTCRFGKALVGSTASNYYAYSTISEASHEGLFLIGHIMPAATGDMPWISLGANASFGAFFYLNSSSGNLVCSYRRLNSGSVVTVTGPAIIINTQYSFVAQIIGGAAHLLVNGKYYGASSALTGSQSTFAYYAVDGLKRDTAAGSNARVMFAGYGLAGPISEGEGTAVSSDIYKILIPA